MEQVTVSKKYGNNFAETGQRQSQNHSSKSFPSLSLGSLLRLVLRGTKFLAWITILGGVFCFFNLHHPDEEPEASAFSEVPQ